MLTEYMEKLENSLSEINVIMCIFLKGDSLSLNNTYWNSYRLCNMTSEICFKTSERTVTGKGLEYRYKKAGHCLLSRLDGGHTIICLINMKISIIKRKF